MTDIQYSIDTFTIVDSSVGLPIKDAIGVQVPVSFQPTGEPGTLMFANLDEFRTFVGALKKIESEMIINILRDFIA